MHLPKSLGHCWTNSKLLPTPLYLGTHMMLMHFHHDSWILYASILCEWQVAITVVYMSFDTFVCIYKSTITQRYFSNHTIRLFAINRKFCHPLSLWGRSCGKTCITIQLVLTLCLMVIHKCMWHYTVHVAIFKKSLSEILETIFLKTKQGYS